VKKCPPSIVTALALLGLFATLSGVHAQTAAARPATQFVLKLFGAVEEGSATFAERQLLRQRRELIASIEGKNIFGHGGLEAQFGRRAFTAGAPANDNDAAVAAGRNIAQKRLASSEVPAGSVQTDDVLAMCKEKNALRQKEAGKRLLHALRINAIGLGAATGKSADDYAAETVRKILDNCAKFLSGEYKNPNAVAHGMLKHQILSDRRAQRSAIQPLFSSSVGPSGFDMEASYEARELLSHLAEGLTPGELQVFNEWAVGSTPEEIATALGIKKQTAYNYISTIRSNLRRLMEDETP
jgi:DNA-directed RNA polymerase specialized sigma24 family protein